MRFPHQRAARARVLAEAAGWKQGVVTMSPSASAAGAAKPSALRLEVIEGDIGLLTFDLPDSRANTLGQAVIAEFEQLVGELSKRSDLHGLILRSGKPGMFIAGADLKELG